MTTIQHTQNFIRRAQHPGVSDQLKNLSNTSDTLRQVIEKINPKVSTHPKSMNDANGKIFGMALLLGINTLAVVSGMDKASKKSPAVLTENERYDLLKKELFSKNKHPAELALSFIDFSLLKKNDKKPSELPQTQNLEWASDHSLFRGLTLLELGQYSKNTVESEKVNQLEKDIDELKGKIDADKKQHQWTCAALMTSQVFVLISIMASLRARR